MKLKNVLLEKEKTRLVSFLPCFTNFSILRYQGDKDDYKILVRIKHKEKSSLVISLQRNRID